MSKFGVQINEEMTFVISLRTWERFISLDSNLATSLRPNEGFLHFQVLCLKQIRRRPKSFPVRKTIAKCCTLFEYGEKT